MATVEKTNATLDEARASWINGHHVAHKHAIGASAFFNTYDRGWTIYAKEPRRVGFEEMRKWCKGGRIARRGNTEFKHDSESGRMFLRVSSNGTWCEFYCDDGVLDATDYELIEPEPERTYSFQEACEEAFANKGSAFIRCDASHTLKYDGTSIVLKDDPRCDFVIYPKDTANRWRKVEAGNGN